MGRRPILALPAFFCLVNIASLHAIANLVTGRRIDRWDAVRGSYTTDANPPGNHAMTALETRTRETGGAGLADQDATTRS